MMRVTSNSFPNTLQEQLARLNQRQSRLQNQAATGQLLTLPEDNPSAMRRILDLQNEAGSVAQYRDNVARHQELATATYSGLKSLRSVVDRASEIATLAGGIQPGRDLKLYATEVNSLIEQTLQVANSRNRGDYLFAGTVVDQPAFAAVRDANGQITAVNYQGNTDVPESEVSAQVELSAQVPGANGTGSGARGLTSDSRTGADIFQHLIALRDRLEAGDVAAITDNSLGEFKADEDHLLMHIGANGALQARLETTDTLLKDRSLSIEALVSQDADADLAQTLVRLSEVQTAYQAALQSGGSILNRSLLDYLR
ncbi:MAG: flagellin [Limisphaerales bacterium]